MSELIRHLTQQEQLNFLLTNRIPRQLLTRLMGRYSRIESPLLTRLSIAVWKLFADDLDLTEAKKKHFNSLQECFIRELKPDVRTVDQRREIISSPCDAIIGACGKIQNGTVYQAKGYPYDIDELIPDRKNSGQYANGIFITLRLKSSMYHRFHAPIDCSVSEINYISGDTWNVNPVALKRIEKLYCKNERAVVELQTKLPGYHITLVPVAAILVASMKFNCLENTLDLNYKGPNRISCSASYNKGDEMGYFQHGSTIILFASSNFRLCKGITDQTPIKMGQALLQMR